MFHWWVTWSGVRLFPCTVPNHKTNLPSSQLSKREQILRCCNFMLELILSPSVIISGSAVMLFPAHWFVSNIFSSDRGNPALPLPPFSQRVSPSLPDVCVCVEKQIEFLHMCLAAVICSALYGVHPISLPSHFSLITFYLITSHDPSSIRSPHLSFNIFFNH